LEFLKIDVNMANFSEKTTEKRHFQAMIERADKGLGLQTMAR